jgi:hypothetical protein
VPQKRRKSYSTFFRQGVRCAYESTGETAAGGGHTMLDVRKLRILREVETRGSIAAAAGALRYTPSAVSQQLAALQVEAGRHAARARRT